MCAYGAHRNYAAVSHDADTCFTRRHIKLIHMLFNGVTVRRRNEVLVAWGFAGLLYANSSELQQC